MTETATSMVELDPTAAPGPDRERRRLVTSVDLAEPLPALELGDWDGALVVVMDGGRPIGRITVERSSAPTDGPLAPDALRAMVRARLGHVVWARSLSERLHRRLGPPWWEAAPRREITVAVCTRDRPVQLAGCLEALTRLDPAPARILVVDNASRESCAPIAARFGVDYVSEPRPGLDNARNRALAACGTEILAFTDDDCRPIPAWLADMSRYFDDAATGAVTGWGCALRLDSAAQIAFEDTGGFGRGARVERFDWLALQPTAAGRTGAGANMAYRVGLIRELGGFPPELDAGTPTQSGGDIYALGRVLAAGFRVVFDPTSMVWHDHRADTPELRRVMRGYGRGIGSMSTRAIVVDGELPAVRSLAWPMKNLVSEAAAFGRGRRNALDLLGAAEQARGVLEAPVVWGRSLWAARGAPRLASPPAATPAAPVRPAPRSGAAPSVSVVIPSIPRRSAMLGRALAALAAQTLPRETFEVVVVVNGPGAESTPDVPGADVTLRRAAPGPAGARNAGAAAARGDLLVFLDDDILAEPGCLAAHLEAHGSGPDRPTLGPAWPPGIGPTLAQQLVDRWWLDHYSRKHRPGHVISFVDVLTGNLGIARELFASLGGLDEEFAELRREDYAFGCTMLGAGVRPRVLPAAGAVHHHASDLARLLADRVREGQGDVLLASRFPVVTANLPLAGYAHPRVVGGRRWRADLRLAEFAAGRGREVVSGAFAALERANLRLRWAELMGHLQRSCYRLGVQRAIDAGLRVTAPPDHRTVVDLDATEPVRADVALGRIVLRWRGEEFGSTLPPDGQWDTDRIVEALVDEAGWPAMVALAETASG